MSKIYQKILYSTFLAILILPLLTIASPNLTTQPVWASYSPGITIEEEAIRKSLAQNQITVSSSGNCSDPENANCTSLAGVTPNTLNSVTALQNNSQCPLRITGAAEAGHMPGPCSHENGCKLDLGVSDCLNKYIKATFTPISQRSDGAQGYQDQNGNIYYLETDAARGPHWDVSFQGQANSGLNSLGSIEDIMREFPPIFDNSSMSQEPSTLATTLLNTTVATIASQLTTMIQNPDQITAALSDPEKIATVLTTAPQLMVSPVSAGANIASSTYSHDAQTTDGLMHASNPTQFNQTGLDYAISTLPPTTLPADSAREAAMAQVNLTENLTSLDITPVTDEQHTAIKPHLIDSSQFRDLIEKTQGN